MTDAAVNPGSAPNPQASAVAASAVSVSPPELRDDLRGLMRRMLVTLGLVGVVSVVVAAAFAGGPGAWAAASGVGLGALLTVGATGLLLLIVDRKPALVVPVLVGGAAVRLALYGVVLVVLSRFDGLHRPSLAVATAVVIVVTLVQELRALSRMPRLYWLDDRQAEVATPATWS